MISPTKVKSMPFLASSMLKAVIANETAPKGMRNQRLYLITSNVAPKKEMAKKNARPLRGANQANRFFLAAKEETESLKHSLAVERPKKTERTASKSSIDSMPNLPPSEAPRIKLAMRIDQAPCCFGMAMRPTLPKGHLPQG